MHGCGNDFVVLDNRAGSNAGSCLDLGNSLITHLANRNTGVGCDQLIVMTNASDNNQADVFMTIYNTDGSISDACGNATRCVAKILFDEDKTNSLRKSILTNRGALKCSRVGDLFQVDMGKPFLRPKDIPIAKDLNPAHMIFETHEKLKLVGTAIGMGNPHCVFFIEDLNQINLHEIGSLIENHTSFPQKTNVEFVKINNRSQVQQRTWERGVGETLACGSGACAVAVAGVLRDLTDRQVSIELKGGTLEIEWRESDGHVLMTGPAEHVFTGEFSL